MKKSLIIAGIALIVVITALIVYSKQSSKKEISTLYSEVYKGDFEILVTTTGELQAENSADIKGPDLTQNRGIRATDIKIQDLVAEGTEVKTGDYIATLDRTNFDNSLKDQLERLTTAETSFELKLLDSAVQLSNLRDNIKNMTFSVEEAEITLQQSKYEPPTTIREAEINVDQAKRTLGQMQKSYGLRVQQYKSDIRHTANDLNDQRQRIKDLQDALSKFIITAPSPGMVIYKRERNGTKRKVASSISPWDPVVATLPDMSSMISKTYVNEIDVSKVKIGQKVNITVDAFPEKVYTGSVISVANIGEQLPNADAKVFEVNIKVDGSDPILRPSMTTGNKIITKTISDVIYVPLECVQEGADSIPFVYTKNKTRQIVLLGESNENNIIIEKGLEPGTIVYLSTPENPEKFKQTGDELVSIIEVREKAKKAEEDSIKMAAEKFKEDRNMFRQFNPDQMRGGQRGGMRDTSAGRRRRGQGGVRQGGQQENQ